MTTTLELPIGTRVRHGVRRTHVRVKHGVRHPGNWLQLIRFGMVGASGFVVNLAVFAVCVHGAKIDYRLASVVAYLISVLSNFWLNRHWTFDAREAHPGHQALKFFAVSLIAYGFQFVILVSLVDSTGMEKVFAQALAVLAAMPLSFIGQKLWSFKA
jgi:putative flippase GtrA